MGYMNIMMSTKLNVKVTNQRYGVSVILFDVFPGKTLQAKFFPF
jgi:hypothetical protein